MSQRVLGGAWLAVGILFVAGLVLALSAWRSLSSRAAEATAERNRLTAEIRQREEEIVREMRTHAAMLQELQWSAAGGDPAVFLKRLADLAAGSRMRVTSIGPLERQSTAQFTKSWHTVQVTAPFREIRELAARVEQEKGVLEDLVVEAQSAASDELTARFRMTALELNPDGKRIVDRALATVGRPGGGRPPALSLPLPRSDGVANLRDPFSFSPAAPPPRRGPTAPPADSTVARAPATERPAAPRSERAPEKTETPEKPETPMELRGIVGFPGGYLAIVNNQIVKVGDSVAGHRVDRIGEREVVLRAPEGNTRVVPLPTVGAASAPVPGAAPGPAGPAPPATPPTGPAAEPGR